MIHTDGRPTIANAPRPAPTAIASRPETPAPADKPDPVVLCERDNVQLRWLRGTDRVGVLVTEGNLVRWVEVDPANALDAFNHPYLYLPKEQ